MGGQYKFRALVEKSGKSHPTVGGFEQYNQIIKVESITFDDDGVDLVVDENGDEYSYHDETLLEVMQYTGLKDSNGVEIYEGDVVNYEGDMSEEIGDVYFDTDEHGFSINVDGSRVVYLVRKISQRYEVIGNVYEHPHLLLEVD